MKLKKIKEDNLKIMYIIDQEYINLNDKEFKVSKSTSNLSSYLNKNNSSLINYLNMFINNKCVHCNNNVINNKFERNIFHTYKFCDICTNNKNYKLYKKVNCSICNKKVLKKDIIEGTCGDSKCLLIYKEKKNNKIKETHWTKNKIIYNDIIDKRTKTRKTNDIKLNRKYKAWNKGKRNIYTKEIIDKIRTGVIKNMGKGNIKKTGIEKKIDNFLKEEKIDYKYSFILNNRQYDFLLKDYNLIIETDGDFWHANPKFYDDNDINKKKLYEIQKMKIIDDKIKNRIAIDNGYQIIRIWEDDINNNFDNVKKIIKKNIKNG